MASLKDMRVRIAATKATQKITKAMQMVAASKLRRAQTAAEAARPYANQMDKVLRNIAAAVAGSSSAPRLLAGTGKSDVQLLVVCTGERGLCGPFNSAIVRLARDRVYAATAEGKQVKILCVGRKGYDQLKRLFEKQIIDTIDLRGVRTLAFEHADGIAKNILARFAAGEVDGCTLFFSRFKSVIAQVPTAQQIIPAAPAADTAHAPHQSESDPRHAAQGGARAAYDYEPEEEEILAELLPRYVATQIFRALIENAA